MKAMTINHKDTYLIGRDAGGGFEKHHKSKRDFVTKSRPIAGISSFKA